MARYGREWRGLSEDDLAALQAKARGVPRAISLYPMLSCTPWRGRALTGEAALTAEVATFLRVESMEGRLHAMWTHVPNEGHRTKTMNALLRCMGLIPGAADFVFVWCGGGAWIELKYGHNQQTVNQRQWQAWCQACEVPYHVCWSLAEVQAVLRELGVWRTMR